MIENGICGWIGLGTGSENHEETFARMLRSVTDDSVTPHKLKPWGEAIAYGPAMDCSFAQYGDFAVIVKGRPRWRNLSLERVAAERNDGFAVLESYARYGHKFLEQLLGSFALALVDPHKRWALLALDRMGVERLCFACTGDVLVFGSSAAVVARQAGNSPPLNQQALFDYLYCHVVPSPETVFAGVEKLLPGECATFDGNAVRRQFYWRLQYRRQNDAPLEDLETRLRLLLRDAVAREMGREDIGAFLSGGTDSSTVSGLLTNLRGQPARTFSIGFSAKGYDEMAYVRIASRHLGTDSHEYYVTPKDVVEALPLIARAYDEPFGNDSAVPTYFCARLARAHGIGVLLAGDGGDEIFGGNTRYAKQKLFEHYWALPRFVRRVIGPTLLRVPGAKLLPPLRKAQSYVRQALIPLPDRLETYNFLHRSPLKEIFEPSFVREIDPERPLALLREVFLRTDSDDPIDRMMHLDLKFTLADNDLRKVSRMCEVAGVEVRFPMLADELVEFSGEVPGALKIKGTRLRFFFKHALRDFLPPETLSKIKHGFGLPFGLWLASDPTLAEQVEGTLTRFADRGMVRADYIAGLWRQHADTHATYFGIMIWVLAELELWLQHHVDGPNGTV